MANGLLILEPYITYFTKKKIIKKKNIESLSFIKNIIHLEDVTILPIYNKGNVEISMINGKIIHFINVVYVSNLYKNLFSICNHNEQREGMLLKIGCVVFLYKMTYCWLLVHFKIVFIS